MIFLSHAGKGVPEMAEKTKEQRIKAESRKLKKLCKGLPENKLAVAVPLIEQAAFMLVTLTDLQAEISETGCVEEYQNGRNQSGFKVTAALQAYNSTVKNYAAVCERLDRILPATPVGSKLASFMAND